LTSRVVLDSSAVLALVRSEPGSEKVASRTQGAVISAVNWCEVLQVARRQGLLTSGFESDLDQLGLQVEAFGVEEARRTALLLKLKGSASLSFGDRACLALAQRLGATAVTADRAWLAVTGVKVEAIR
jgi:ribonuclease VapC